MSNSTHTDGGTFASRIKQSSSGILRFAGLGAGILGSGAGLKAWIVVLIVAFSIIS